MCNFYVYGWIGVRLGVVILGIRIFSMGYGRICLGGFIYLRYLGFK